MSWITVKLLGIRKIQQDGVFAPERPTLDLIGATVEDDPAGGRTKITFLGVGTILGVTGVAPITVVDDGDSQHRKVSIAAASGGNAGSMSAANFTKLAGIEDGAQVCTSARVLAGLAAAASDVSVNSQKITNVADGTASNNAVNKGQLDTVSSVASSAASAASSAAAAAAAASAAAASKVASVSVTAPATLGGTSTAPVIGVQAASGSQPGYLDSSDFTKLSGIEAGAQVCSAAHVLTALASAAGAISVNGQNITNAPSLANASGAVSITAGNGDATVDADSGHHAKLGTGTAGGAEIGHGTITIALTGLQDGVYAGITTTKTPGRQLRNTTASNSGAPQHIAPSDVDECTAFVSGNNKVFQWRRTTIGRTNGAIDHVLEYSTDGGVTWGEFARGTTASAGQFATGWQSYAFIVGGGGVFSDTWGSGLFFGGGGAAQVKSYDSGNPLLLHSDQGIDKEIAAGSYEGRNWGTVGVNYDRHYGKVITTTNATTTTAFTFAMPDNCAVKWDVDVYCYNTADASMRAYFGKRAGFNRNGGAPSSDFAVDKHADEVLGVWGSPPTVAITAGTPGTNDVSVRVTGILATNIKWIIQLRYQVTTTSA